MNVLERLHAGYVYGLRVQTLATRIAELLPSNARVLDVGCGDGRLAAQVVARRPDTSIEGLEVLVRDKTFISVAPFDGRSIPYPEGSYDVVMFVDVLHHAEHPDALLREAVRVARQGVIIKDHLREGFLAAPTLRFMDFIGNVRFGVSLPYNYWSRQQWRGALSSLDIASDAWSESLNLYPWWANWAFGRSLHFIARLVRKA